MINSDFYFCLGDFLFWLSFILVVFHYGHLPFLSSSCLVVFSFGHFPLWSNSILVIFHFGCLPFWLSSILVLYDLSVLCCVHCFVLTWTTTTQSLLWWWVVVGRHQLLFLLCTQFSWIGLDWVGVDQLLSPSVATLQFFWQCCHIFYPGAPPVVAFTIAAGHCYAYFFCEMRINLWNVLKSVISSANFLMPFFAFFLNIFMPSFVFFSKFVMPFFEIFLCLFSFFSEIFLCLFSLFF